MFFKTYIWGVLNLFLILFFLSQLHRRFFTYIHWRDKKKCMYKKYWGNNWFPLYSFSSLYVLPCTIVKLICCLASNRIYVFAYFSLFLDLTEFFFILSVFIFYFKILKSSLWFSGASSVRCKHKFDRSSVKNFLSLKNQRLRTHIFSFLRFLNRKRFKFVLIFFIF